MKVICNYLSHYTLLPLPSAIEDKPSAMSHLCGECALICKSRRAVVLILRAEGADGASDAIENCLVLQEVCLAVEVALSLSPKQLIGTR